LYFLNKELSFSCHVLLQRSATLTKVVNSVGKRVIGFFAATPSAGANSTVSNQFYATGYPISGQTGTKSYCAFDDGVVRQQPAGTIGLVASYIACQGLLPIAN
jgi:hypothetical protein